MVRAHRLLAGGLLGLLAAGLAPGVASAANPTIIQYRNNTPQAVQGGAYGTVATVHLGAGRWLVLAKAELAFPEQGDAHQTTTCTLFINGGLAAGLQSWMSISQPNSTSTTAGVASGVNESFSLSIGNALNHADSALLRCYTNAGLNHVFIRQIHITAIKVNKLSVFHSGSSTPTVYGSGTPEAIWMWNTAGTALSSGGSAFDSSLNLPAGNWMAVASSNLYATSGSPGYGSCDLQDVATLTQSSWRTTASGTPGDAVA